MLHDFVKFAVIILVVVTLFTVASFLPQPPTQNYTVFQDGKEWHFHQKAPLRDTFGCTLFEKVKVCGTYTVKEE